MSSDKNANNEENMKNYDITGINKKKLGRGIASLLATDDDFSFNIDLQNDKDLDDINTVNNQLKELDINDILPNPNQPRKYFDDTKLQELSESIKNSGLLQPIIVSVPKSTSDGEKYIIIAGERRFRASKIAGLKKIKAIVLNLNDEEILKNAILENIQRENLNPIEEANGYRKIIDTFGYTHEKLAKEIGKSRAHITNLLRVLTLTDNVQDALKNKTISLGHAKVLIGTENPDKYLSYIVEQHLSVRQLEEIIASDKQKNNADDKNGKKNNDCFFDDNNIELAFNAIRNLKNHSVNNTKTTTDKAIHIINNRKENFLNSTDDEWMRVQNDIKIIEKQLLDSCGFKTCLKLQQDGSGKCEIFLKDLNDLLKLVKLLH